MRLRVRVRDLRIGVSDVGLVVVDVAARRVDPPAELELVLEVLVVVLVRRVEGALVVAVLLQHDQFGLGDGLHHSPLAPVRKLVDQRGVPPCRMLAEPRESVLEPKPEPLLHEPERSECRGIALAVLRQHAVEVLDRILLMPPPTPDHGMDVSTEPAGTRGLGDRVGEGIDSNVLASYQLPGWLDEAANPRSP